MKHLMIAAAVVAVIAGVGFPQSTSTTPPDALALLQQVSRRYADATSYIIKANEERTSNNEWEHS